MRKMLVSAFMAVVTAMSASADYPTLYLRGDMTNGDWGAHEEYRFNNDNGTYTLHLDNLSGGIQNR